MFFVVLCVLQKAWFMLVYDHVIHARPLTEYISAIFHGLPMDCSIAGYLTAIPALLIIGQSWTGSRWIFIVEKVYYAIIALTLSLIFSLDLGLYAYWGFRLDMTPIFYFTSSPASALASVTWSEGVLGTAGILFGAAGIYACLAYISRKIKVTPVRKASVTIVMLLLTALLFIPIRGGVTVSSMNLSRAYFSTNQRLNHAAVNPVFSLMYSATHQHDFGAQYRFMTADEATSALAALDSITMSRPAVAPDSVPLLNESRPDIYIVILESFSAHLMPSLGGEPIAIKLDSLAREGLSFTDIYANSFRTDRGIPAILSSFPGQPSMSIMKYVEKTENLPSLPGELKKAGYDIKYFYGGDANFTNMQAYLVNAGFENIISDKDFTLREKASKWGAHDNLLFDKVIADVKATPADAAPKLRVIQTSSSHEPFDVPYHSPRFSAEPEKNAFAFTDSCLFAFTDILRQSPRYDKSLIIFVPDHQGCFPAQIDDVVKRHHIPLVMTGGALNRKASTDATIGSQIDLGATLLTAMGLDGGALTYSKDLLGSGPHYAVISDPAIISIVTQSDTIVYNCDANQVIDKKLAIGGEQSETILQGAKAFLQTLYDRIENL